MAMGLHIQNPEAERLIKELAARTGQNEVDAVIEAVRERLGRLPVRQPRLPPDELAAELLRIGREAAARLTPEQRTMDYDALLYDDETGLPR